METEQIDELLLEKIRQTFPSANLRHVLEILELYGEDEYDARSVRLAGLKLCDGDLNKLLGIINSAKDDYRDVLAWAESPKQMQTAPSALDAMPPDAANQIREDDRRQYRAWLRGEDESVEK